jgi:hypothetical protein
MKQTDSQLDITLDWLELAARAGAFSKSEPARVDQRRQSNPERRADWPSFSDRRSEIDSVKRQ